MRMEPKSFTITKTIPMSGNNLASEKQHKKIIEEHAAWLPKTNAKPFENLR